MLYNLLSDYEILRLQLCRLGNFFACYQTRRIASIRRRPILSLTHDTKAHGWFKRSWQYTQKHFAEEQIQDSIMAKKKTKVAAEEKE